ncbi:hypothetical protein GCM10029964_091930 [Kibdelosporangium lantanae]
MAEMFVVSLVTQFLYRLIYQGGLYVGQYRGSGLANRTARFCVGQKRAQLRHDIRSEVCQVKDRASPIERRPQVSIEIKHPFGGVRKMFRSDPSKGNGCGVTHIGLRGVVCGDGA